LEKHKWYARSIFVSAQWASGMKTPWNIEPWRPDVSYAATVAKACNP